MLLFLILAFFPLLVLNQTTAGPTTSGNCPPTTPGPPTTCDNYPCHRCEKCVMAYYSNCTQDFCPTHPTCIKERDDDCFSKPCRNRDEVCRIVEEDKCIFCPCYAEHECIRIKDLKPPVPVCPAGCQPIPRWIY